MKRGNFASIATVRANGMTLADEFTDSEGEQMLVHGICREEWERRQKGETKQ